MFDSIGSIEKASFEGFVPLSAAKVQAPNTAGVYLVLRESGESPPAFLDRGTGGFFKGRDPNVSRNELELNWVEATIVLYIGQTQRELSKRLKELNSFGSGNPVAHYGGRLLWQIPDSECFSVCWKRCEEPKGLEASLLQQFETVYGKLPFANLRR